MFILMYINRTFPFKNVHRKLLLKFVLSQSLCKFIRTIKQSIQMIIYLEYIFETFTQTFYRSLIKIKLKRNFNTNPQTVQKHVGRTIKKRDRERHALSSIQHTNLRSEKALFSAAFNLRYIIVRQQNNKTIKLFYI